MDATAVADLLGRSRRAQGLPRRVAATVRADVSKVLASEAKTAATKRPAA
jgi:hypothetical protein